MRKFKYTALLFLVGLMSFAQETFKIQVKENKVPCTSVVETECLQVKFGKSKKWVNFYQQIEGFTYEPGFLYKLKVEKKTISEPIPADASSYHYKLIKVLSKKKVKNSSDVAVEQLDIFNKKLVLTQLNGKNISSGSVYFELNKLNHTLTGKSGVNRFNANFEFKNNQLFIKPGMSTLMAGDENSMKLENEFIQSLNKPFKVKEKNNEIQLIDPSNNKVVMVLKAPTIHDIWTFINGKHWKLFTLDNVGRDYGDVFIEFDTEGKKVSGYNGCNRFFGEFTTVNNQITFGALGTTRMMCTTDEAKETESLMMQYLNESTLEFDVAEQTLNFYKDNRLVMMFGLEF